MRAIRLLASFLLLVSFVAACDDGGPTGPGSPAPSGLTIASTNVEADGALYGNALRVQLSAPLDTASLGAARIITTSSVTVVEPPLYIPVIVQRPMEIWRVVGAEAVRLNGEPSTFWYDPATASVLVMREQTDYGIPPYTPFSSGTNVIELTTALRDTEGQAPSDPLTVSFERRALAPGGPEVALQPNPVGAVTAYSRNSDERLARFVNLPETATIVIQDPAGEPVTLQKDGPASTVDWATPLDRTGLFPYEVREEGEVIARGIAVLASEAFRRDAP